MCLPFYVIQLANLHTLFLQDSELSADESHGRGRGRGRGIGRGRARGRGQQRGVRGRRGRGGGQKGRGRGQLVQEEQAGENADNHDQQLVVRYISVSLFSSLCI